MSLVQVFTAEEQRARTSQAYVRSAVGERLRCTGHTVEERPDATALTVTQLDALTGLQVTTTITRLREAPVYRFESVATNTSRNSITLTALSSAALGFGHHENDLDDVRLGSARSEWLAENRWHEQPIRKVLPRIALAFHGQDGRGHHGITSHGAWSSGEHLPAGTLRRSDGQTIMWQIESSAGWHCDLSQARDGGVLSLLGPTDLENQFAVALQPGESFSAVPVAIAVSSDGVDGAAAALTRYRRWLRAANRATDELPLVYNDFMNTLMGQPSTEALLPLIHAAADAGAECFCIDAGWYADPAIGDWWATVGEWRESPARFSGGLGEVIAAIHSRGMRSGIWLEPEVVGVESPIAAALPEDAFFHRFGVRVREHDRYQVDFRHPAVREHLDDVVEGLIGVYGISYFKLDYNINPGAGTDAAGGGSAAGLLGHTRAFAEWISALRARHPQVSIENCSSGAMRSDYGLLAVTQLQSTSDQQDFRLYPPVAVSAPATIVPEQCGNWAYPAADMSAEETVFSLVTGLSGRLYLSGFLHNLAPENRAVVSQAAELYKSWRGWLAEATPFWPLGLPDWDDETLCLGLTDGRTTRLFVWDRASVAGDIRLPGVLDGRNIQQVELGPVRAWDFHAAGSDLLVRTRSGLGARIFELR